MYVPDICSTKEKFTYAQSKDQLKKTVKNVAKEFQVNDHADLNEEGFLKVFNH